MPTFQILSDLHFEFLRDYGASFTESLDPEGVDCLLLAGDICTPLLLETTFQRFVDRFPRVVYVTGNHDYYGSSPQEVHQILAGLEGRFPNFTWLNHDVVEVGGVLVAGSTLWFPEYPDEVLFPGLNDFNQIQDMRPWVYEENAIAQAFLSEVAGDVDIIMTHHMPHPGCVSERFRTGPAAGYNRYFMFDMSEVIEASQPPLWVHGHTHDRKDFMVGETRIVSNPWGYPHEKEFPARGAFQKRLLIEVERSQE